LRLKESEWVAAADTCAKLIGLFLGLLALLAFFQHSFEFSLCDRLFSFVCIGVDGRGLGCWCRCRRRHFLGSKASLVVTRAIRIRLTGCGFDLGGFRRDLLRRRPVQVVVPMSEHVHGIGKQILFLNRHFSFPLAPECQRRPDCIDGCGIRPYLSGGPISLTAALSTPVAHGGWVQ
jgi:hypothetical protein